MRVYKLTGVFPEVNSVIYKEWDEMVPWLEDEFEGAIHSADNETYKVTIEIVNMTEEEYEALDKDWY